MTGFSCTMWAEMTCVTHGWLCLIARSPVSHPFFPCLGEHGHLCDLWMWRSIMPVWIWNAVPAQGGIKEAIFWLNSSDSYFSFNSLYQIHATKTIYLQISLSLLLRSDRRGALWADALFWLWLTKWKGALHAKREKSCCDCHYHTISLIYCNSNKGRNEDN